MHPSSPRCQSNYLYEVCKAAEKNMTDNAPFTNKRFYLAESDHRRFQQPPIPFLIIAHNSIVSM